MRTLIWPRTVGRHEDMASAGTPGRWWILLVVCLAQAFQVIQWLALAAVPKATEVQTAATFCFMPAPPRALTFLD